MSVLFCADEDTTVFSGTIRTDEHGDYQSGVPTGGCAVCVGAKRAVASAHGGLTSHPFLLVSV